MPRHCEREGAVALDCCLRIRRKAFIRDGRFLLRLRDDSHLSKKKRPRRQTNWEAWTAVLGRWTYRFLPRTPKGYRFELVRGAVAIDDAGVASRRRGHPILSTVGPGLNALLYAAMTVSAMTDNILKEMRCVRITRRPTKSTRSSRRRIGCPPRRRARGESSPTKSTRCSRGGSCDPRR